MNLDSNGTEYYYLHHSISNSGHSTFASRIYARDRLGRQQRTAQELLCVCFFSSRISGCVCTAAPLWCGLGCRPLNIRDLIKLRQFPPFYQPLGVMERDNLFHQNAECRHFGAAFCGNGVEYARRAHTRRCRLNVFCWVNPAQYRVGLASVRRFTRGMRGWLWTEYSQHLQS